MTSPIGLRIATTSHPLLYEVNARVLLSALSRKSGSPVTLGTIPDDVLNGWSALGFDAIWMMGVWETGAVGRAIARRHPDLYEEYKKALPDVTDADIVGSPYAVKSYVPPAALGGIEGVQRLRQRLHDRGVALILDFVCNHTARDHGWVATHPEYYIQGAPDDEKTLPEQFFEAATEHGVKAIAYGKDPYFPGWTDTAQLDYRNPDMQSAMCAELVRIAGLCDGVRCDMAMLVLDKVFSKTWPGPAGQEGQPEFWSHAIQRVREVAPHFLFIAEAYWNLEWDLQQLGFDFTYDKTLYDRLVREGAAAVRDHLKADLTYQERSLRFIENHDESPAAQVMPSESWQFAAAAVAGTVPGMLMIHDGQLEGNPVKVPVQLVRRAERAPNPRTLGFYFSLLNVLRTQVFRTGRWRQLLPRAAWGENHSWTNFVASWWHDDNSGDRLVVVNYAPLSSQCYIDLPSEHLKGNIIEFRDLMGHAVYLREKGGLESKGMFFDLQPYSFHLFAVNPAKRQ